MRERGLTQAELARQLEVGDATVSEWLSRGRVPQGDILLRLPHLLSVNGHWLLTGEGPRELHDAGDDPYVTGALEVVTRLRAHLEELERRFGGQHAAAPTKASLGKEEDAD